MTYPFIIYTLHYILDIDMDFWEKLMGIEDKE